MAIGKIKPTVTIAAQFVAGVEVECIQQDGKLFLPVMNLGDFAASDPVPSKPAKTVKEEVEDEAPAKSKPAKTTKDSEAKTYTEEALMEMDVKELTKILKGMGIDPNDTDGKNTNKKLRLLILDNQEDAPAEEEEDAEEEAPKKSSKKKVVEDDEEAAHEDTVAEILEDFDSGKLSSKKAHTKLMELAAEGVKEKVITDLLTQFEEDEEIDINEFSVTVTEALAGKKAKKADKAPKAEKKPKKENLVAREDLEVGMRVSVYWEDQEEWYDGEVASIKKGKVTIDYDDDTSEVLDENNTKIKLLSE